MRLHFLRDYFTLEETSAKWKNGIKISKCPAQKLSVKFFPDFGSKCISNHFKSIPQKMFQFFSIFGLHIMTKNLKNSSKMIFNTILALARVLFCTILALKIRQRRHISQCSHFRDNPSIRNTSKHVRNGLEALLVVSGILNGS